MRHARVWAAALLALAGCGGSDASLPGDEADLAQPGGLPAALAQGTRIFFTSTRDGNREIYVMRGDGSQPTNLTRNAAEECCAAPSADGRLVAFATSRGADFPLDTPEDVWIMEADGTGPRRVFDNVEGEEITRVVFGPDGRRIAIEGPSGGDRSVLVVNVDGTGGRAVSPGDSDGDPTFSPDGRKVVFASTVDDAEGLYAYDVERDRLDFIVADPVRGTASDPRFSPDGRQIAFASGGDLYVVNAEGTGLRQLTDARRIDFDPAWSPDGTKLAFVRQTRGVEGYPEVGAEVHVLDLATGRETNASGHEAEDFGPVWSPDGAWLAFTSDRDEDEEIYAVRADGTRLTRLTNSPGHDAAAAWIGDADMR